MTEFHELDKNEQKHATVIEHIIATERAGFDRIKHNVDDTKRWLANHKLLAGSVMITAKMFAYLVRKYNIGKQLPPPSSRF